MTETPDIVERLSRTRYDRGIQEFLDERQDARTEILSLRAERDELRAKLETAGETICLAALPLEAMKSSGSINLHTEGFRDAVSDAILKIRATLTQIRSADHAG
ncbi:hypothetical protein [Croceicoccus sp. YJ47]|uniref:hypothetical protein n=1 Tax=Croceicoccus sp. YJ47 TaxID=2798724 RepID=UPI00192471C9|nr:hypothetical protein [Croceicoccus sp. YJ47]QQN73908.1 hypothetical protein JD971_14355 [Croceicoccus sp. YJ47]